MKRIIYIIGMCSIFFSFFSYLNAQTCRTPSYLTAVVFEPVAYHLGNHSTACVIAMDNHQYTVDQYIQAENPGTNPTVKLTDFINEMQSGNIGVLFLHSHSNTGGFGIEFYENNLEGEIARDSTWNYYVDSLGINTEFIYKGHNDGGYDIGVTYNGLDHWCTNLDETLVFVKGCSSSGLNDNWNSLTALGYNVSISGLSGVDTFFKRMDGDPETRGPENESRSVDDAKDGIDHLVAEGNVNVVLSPIVLEHQPENYGLVEEGQIGYVEFDCEMDQSIPEEEVVTITGTIGELSNMDWVNDHRLKFTITNLEEFASVDFRVHADKAISEHNGSQLDGNNNPNGTNGSGPNEDFYNWSSLTSHFAMMDFEDGLDGDPIQSSIPGMEFITTEGYDWIYGDKTTGNYNIYPYKDSLYYWCNGNFFAWLGINQGMGRINFTGATATSVSMGTSCFSGLCLEAYNENGTLIDSDFASGNLETKTLSCVKVTGARIDHVIVHDSGNYWLIDDLIVVDLLQETLILLPEDYAEILNELHTISPGEVENILVWIEDISENMEIILNWLEQVGGRDDAEMKLTIFKPDGTIYEEYQSIQPPIDVNIANPIMGNWTFEVTAINIPEDNFPFAIVAATENESVMDCYIENDDIWFYPEEPFEGEEVNIYAKISNSTQSEFVNYIKARCYLGDPDNGGIQIDDNEYAINISPGSVDTVYFNMESTNLGGENIIFIKIDPDNELDEYNEDNNKASNNIFIQPPVIINVPTDQPTIQGGITAAANGDIVLVQPGTYVENINYNGKLITVASLFLTTQDTTYISSTIINGNNSGSVVTFNTSENSSAVLCGFTIINGSADNGGGIYCDNSSPKLQNVTITGNNANFGGGFYCNISSPRLENVTISDNSAVSDGGGIYCNISSPRLENVTISDNSATSNGGGIYVCNYSSPRIINSILWNDSPQEIYIVSGYVAVTYSDIQGGWVGTGNIDSDPLFLDAGNGNYHLQPISPCIDAGDPVTQYNDPDGTITDMGAYYFHQHLEPVWHISMTGSDITGNGSEQFPFATIQLGINYSTDTDTVLVQPGTYVENINYNGKLITLASLFLTTQDTTYISTTIIDGDSSGSVVYFDNGEDSTAVLCGFTITNGSGYHGGGIYCYNSSPSLENITISGNTCYSDRGGGIYCYQSNPRLENVTITNNYTNRYGGGIYCYNSSPSLENVTISDNFAHWRGGGIFCSNYSSPILQNVTIAGNYARTYGGGICCYNSSPSLQNVTIAGNSAIGQPGIYGFGGGIYCANYSSPSLENVTITGNSAVWDGGGIFCSNYSAPSMENVTIAGNNAHGDGGGIYCDNSSPSLENVTISGNTAQHGDGGGIWCDNYSSPILENVTISGNTAHAGDGGGIWCDNYSSPCLINSILWNDTPEEIYILSGTVTATYSDIQGGWAGTGNIDNDPLFVDPAIGDYHLQSTSPCIDAGDPDPQYNDPDGTRNDMGADFFDTTIYLDPPQNVTVEIISTEVHLSWDAVSGANSYKVYSSDDPNTGFVEDTSGSFAGESWSAPIGDVKRFYHVIASTEIIRSKKSDTYNAKSRNTEDYDSNKVINKKRK